MNEPKAPGIASGLFAWAKDEHAEVAHCYRRGYGTDVALCAHRFARRIEFPHNRDAMCGTCRVKASEIESDLSN